MTSSENGISTPSRETDLRFTLTNCCPVPNKMNWVFPVFNFQRFSDIQQFISSVYVTNWGVDDSRSSAFLSMWSCSSSAYGCARRPCQWAKAVISVVYKRNNTEPRMLPCGTPHTWHQMCSTLLHQKQLFVFYPYEMMISTTVLCHECQTLSAWGCQDRHIRWCR